MNEKTLYRLTWLKEVPKKMDDTLILLITIFIALILTVFNFTTVAITLFDRKLRSRISNYPVISFLIASTFQGMFAAPITTYKQIEHKEHITGWVCDLSRVSYYLCHHLVKISLVIVSFDRLFSIKYPFKYAKYGKKKNMIILLIISWMITLIIDMLPFIHDVDDEVCHYVVKKQWKIFIIIVYNITPFLLVTMNYVIIWAFAASVALLDRRISDSISRNSSSYGRDESMIKLKRESRRKSKNKGKLQFLLELKATKTSLALVSAYIICWGPLGMCYIIETFCEDCIKITRESKSDIHEGLMYLCFSSNVLAPLIYCWFSKEYRKAGKRVLHRAQITRKRAFSWFNQSNRSSQGDNMELTMSSTHEKCYSS